MGQWDSSVGRAVWDSEMAQWVKYFLGIYKNSEISLFPSDLFPLVLD